MFTIKDFKSSNMEIPVNSRKRWSSDQVMTLVQMVKKMESIQYIAETMGRTVTSIYLRILKESDSLEFSDQKILPDEFKEYRNKNISVFQKFEKEAEEYKQK